MRYFKLGLDADIENIAVCHCENDYGIDYKEFIFGNKGTNWNESFYFYYDKEEGDVLTDYLANVKGWFLVSEKLKKLLDCMNTKIQYFPVSIVERKSGAKHTYFIANVLRLVDALCLELSDYYETEIPNHPTIYMVSKYCIYEKKTQGADIFKLSEDEIPIFVSEKFKEIIESNEITGIYLYEIRVA